MNIVPFVHEGLGNSSYLVEVAPGEAALIDPDRSVERYLAAARERGWTIRAVFETHVHADFVSGVCELAAALDARAFLPAEGGYRFPIEPLRPGQRVTVGASEFEAIASPGHTPEHLSYVVRGGGTPALFSGGALIAGGAARTDLIAPAETERLTRAQFRTLREAFAVLPDETLLLPTHGGGSFCSAGAGAARTSTLGVERRDNAALAIEDEEAFVRWFPGTFPAAPDYFFRMRAFNQAGPRLRREIDPPPPLSPDAFDAARAGALVVDVRQTEAYARGHIEGSLSIAFRESYAVWLGWLAPPDVPLLFVTGDEPVDRVVEESLLVGYEGFAGRLAGGVDRWEGGGRELRGIEVIDADGMRAALREGAVALDVREPDEVRAGAVPGALAVPLGALAARIDEVPRDRPVVTYCAHGERSMSAVSLLERASIASQTVQGGFEAWTAAGLGVARASS